MGREIPNLLILAGSVVRLSPSFDRCADSFRVRSLVQNREQLAQTCVVELDGSGPQIVHLDDLTEKRIEESQGA